MIRGRRPRPGVQRLRLASGSLSVADLHRAVFPIKLDRILHQVRQYLFKSPSVPGKPIASRATALVTAIPRTDAFVAKAPTMRQPVYDWCERDRLHPFPARSVIPASRKRIAACCHTNWNVFP